MQTSATLWFIFFPGKTFLRHFECSGYSAFTYHGRSVSICCYSVIDLYSKCSWCLLLLIFTISSMLHSCSTNIHWRIASCCLITKSDFNWCVPSYFLYSQIIIHTHKLYLFSSHIFPNLLLSHPSTFTLLIVFYCLLYPEL